jgi:hypothetical protein
MVLNRLLLATGAALFLGLLPHSVAWPKAAADESSDSMSISTASTTERAEPVKRRLQLTSAWRGAEHSRGEGPSLTESWRRAFGADGTFEYGDLLSLTFQGDFVDLRRSGGDGDEGGLWFVEAATGGWEENTVNDARIDVGLFDHRLHLTSRRAGSRYSGSGSYLRANDNDDDGKSRFVNHEGAAGSAVLYRLDAEVLRGGEADLSVFARYQKVEPFFHSLALSDNKGRDPSGKQDPFGKPNQEIVEFGTTVGLGPAKLTLSRVVRPESRSPRCGPRASR